MVRVKEKYKYNNLLNYGFIKLSSNRYMYEISEISCLLVSTTNDEYMKKGQICFHEYISENARSVKPIDKITNLDVIYRMFEDGVLEYYEPNQSK